MLENHWYIAAAGPRLRRKPRAVRVLDRDLVLFRDGSGRARALLDRCCHRGVRLSRGTTSNGCVVCPYHGWEYDGSGRCTHIPSLREGQRIAGNVSVPSFPCVERDAYVWVWVGAGEPEPARPPAIPRYEEYKWFHSSSPMECEYIRGIENNIDPCHAAYTHRFSHPQWYMRRLGGLRNSRTEVRTTENGLVLFAPAAASISDPIPEAPIVKASFDLPDRVIVDLNWRYRMVIVMNFVPTGPTTCRVETLARNPSGIGPKLVLNRREPTIIRQDREVMESAQPWYDRDGGAFERSVEADYSMLLARRIVELAAQGRFEEKRSSLPKRRVLEIRV